MAKTKIHIDGKYASLFTQQNYSKKPVIEDVRLVDLKMFTGEDGYFLELARLKKDAKIDGFPNFQVKQLSYSHVAPGGIKAWHIHLNQDDLWFVPPESTMLVGLVDLRKNSTTFDEKMRLVLGNHKAQLLLIPKGVAHGVCNIASTPGSMVYLLNQQFNPDNPDEHRLAWDHFGKDFWAPFKG